MSCISVSNRESSKTEDGRERKHIKAIRISGYTFIWILRIQPTATTLFDSSFHLYQFGFLYFLIIFTFSILILLSYYIRNIRHKIIPYQIQNSWYGRSVLKDKQFGIDSGEQTHFQAYIFKLFNKFSFLTSILLW